MKLENKWYWLDERFEWNLYHRNIQDFLKQHCNKTEMKLKRNNNNYIFNFKKNMI